MKKWLLITDIGSTNTKAVLFNQEFQLIDIQKQATTVEMPYEDVKIGLFRAVKELERNNKITLLAGENKFTEEVDYLTTSSAGGGLQILVIGLSMNDSASSAQRTAYGAGGVILDTLAIDDKRSTVEQIQLIDLLRPDIILFSGGIDGGAYASVIRMGELLNAANPQPKFGVSAKIPLIYAGNIEAQDFIRTMFADKYDLHLVPNIRPTMKDENPEPARDEIHRLFMENVMEQAPGYSDLKDIVANPIIPTPTGVIKSLQTISKSIDKHIISVDIGGATTDIFSNIFGKYYRTVSANYGMSYSIANVMADTGFDHIRRWLPSEWDDNYIRNYICNKMLYPTFITQNEPQLAIEQAAAREAISLSQKHHLQMNFQTQRIGLLDQIKASFTQKFKEAMYYEKSLAKKRFFLSDFDIIIGAGGVMSGAKNINQVIMMLADGFQIKGITEIWSDPDFISPHLGKFSEVNPEKAEELLFRYGYKKLALIIKPYFEKIEKVLSIKIPERKETHEIFADTLLTIAPADNITIKAHSKATISQNNTEITLSSDVPIIVDTRINYDIHYADKMLNLYQSLDQPEEQSKSFAHLMSNKQIMKGKGTIVRSLPYKGEIYSEVNQYLSSNTLLGETKFAPPQLYIINLITMFNIDAKDFQAGLLIKEGDEINPGHKIFDLGSSSLLSYNKNYSSFVRGIVERINFKSGSIFVREIQDYPLKPITLNIAEHLGIPPKNLKGIMKKRLNDFVRTGEIIAQNLFKEDKNDLSRGKGVYFNSPTTGTITDVNYQKGTITIQYIKKPYSIYAGVRGKVLDIIANRSVLIEYEGTTINGIIGFGKENYSTLKCIDNPDNFEFIDCKDKIIASFQPVELSFLEKASQAKIKGLIIPSLNNSDLVKFIGAEIGVALTGKEQIPYSIIVTEGFGAFPMHNSIKELLLQSETKEVYLNTFTQIRAGVQRPQIIISK